MTNVPWLAAGGSITGMGMLGAVLWWFMNKFLPAKDALFMQLQAAKDEVIRAKDAQLDRRDTLIDAIVQKNADFVWQLLVDKDKALDRKDDLAQKILDRKNEQLREILASHKDTMNQVITHCKEEMTKTATETREDIKSLIGAIEDLSTSVSEWKLRRKQQPPHHPPHQPPT